MQEIIIVGGLTAIAVLWVGCIAMMLQVLWDTFGEHAEAIIKRLKKE